MSFDLETLYALLPAVYRIRDVALVEQAKALIASDEDLAQEFVGLLTIQEEEERLGLIAESATPGTTLSLAKTLRLKELEDKRQRGPLKALLAVIAEQIAVIEEDLEQLYDDQFIETCAEWVVPYIGDLVGTRGLFYFPSSTSFSQRAQVANTIAYRRRKGTASVLEQLARDVTAWDASVVEYFQLLATTQYMNHLRPQNLSFASVRRLHFGGPQEQLLDDDLTLSNNRQWHAIEYSNTPFDRFAHTADVRRIASRRGKHNIPNVGIYLWRIGSYPVSDAPAYKMPDMGDPAVDGRRYRFNALGKDTPLYNRTATETEITHLAEPVNVPMPLSPRVLDRYLNLYYGADGESVSILLTVDGAPVSASEIHVCDLSDRADGAGWSHQTSNMIAIDPALGRIVLLSAPQSLRVSYRYGFSAEMGGGEYGRVESFTEAADLLTVGKSGASYTTIKDALDALVATLSDSQSTASGGVIEIIDNEYYAEALTITAPTGKTIELRAADGKRPVLLFVGDATISGGEDAEIILNGLVVASGALSVPDANDNHLAALRLRHCTLAPGPSPAFVEFEIPERNETTASKAEPKIVVDITDLTLEIDHCIVGQIRITDGSEAHISDSIVDTGSEIDPHTDVAYAAPDNVSGGGAIEIENSTVIGRVHTQLMTIASNTIFFADFKPGESWPDSVSALGVNAPVLAERLQEGCVRYSYLPPNSRAPHPYRCQPEGSATAVYVQPVFTSLRYGDAGYCQLSERCSIDIRTGADDQAEMGAFHDLFQPQRVANLATRLDEYLRFGLEAGIFYAS